ncbi:DNA helicase [Gammaproteobacteria bacterium]
MNASILDLEQRELALDPTKSFIVQAPAGSGKTSLLVQRYLMLLATVKAPEEILAITFTRKAAHEMQSRIVRAIKQATNNIQAQDKHEATTQKLALAALKQNQTHAWNITQNPQRLRIQTIDAFCNHLVRRMPILAKSSIDPKIIQNQEAEIYYLEIARAVLKSSDLPEYTRYLETLLLHLDNDWQRVENLFITMLKSREQWLPHIVGLKNTKELRQNMELALKTIIQENLERCLALFPQNLQKELYELLEFSKNNHKNPPLFLQQHTAVEDFYSGIAEFLLTQEFTWRKKITKEHGFPAQATGRNKQEKEFFKLMKERMESLLAKFSEHENFRMSLENLLCSPPPNYGDQQWEMVEALLKLLPLLAAQLKVTFNECGVTDHAEISMTALRAMGESDTPTELALNLDYRLQHLLVDEFQDTAIAQYRLIEKLIATWQQGDGRTLFVVGDPMQSIYRFREAEVGLFLRAQTNGIGALPLQPLTLITNFRSNQSIIDWININFAKIFPVMADIGFGGVPFRPSTAIKQEQNSQVTVELLANTDIATEATHVVSITQKLQQQNPEATIAILVRARSHLQEIIVGLRTANLNYQAHELENLGASIVVRDLFALTRALLHLADRVAWLAILRAPWCGLNLKDLCTIANGNAELIWDNLCNYHNLNLSTDGKKLVQKFKLVLKPILAKCGRVLWRELVEEAWLMLGGPATATTEAELEHAKIYLELLETNSLDVEVLQKKLSELYAPATQITNIQIMTIHKAKGLEFDHVIIPGIDRATRFDERKLMLWFEQPQIHGGSSLLLAPIEASGSETDPVYQYLQLVEQKKSFYETGRLLYVALTRAKKTVHLIGCIKPSKEKPNIIGEAQKDNLLKQLKPCFNENWIINKFKKSNIDISNEQIKSVNNLQRLSKDWIIPIAIKTD